MSEGLAGLGAAFGIPDGEGGTLYMRQHISMLEALTVGIFEKANIYDVYKAEGFKDEDKIVKIEARSTNCERMCCAPNHSIMLHVKDTTGKTFITIQRKGCGSGKFCLGGCCAIAGPCQDGIIVHDGEVTAEPACCNMGNKCCDGCGHGDLKNPNPISKASVPMCGGFKCTPNISVFEDFESTEPNGKMTGPCCFGGCLELCKSDSFKYSTNDDREIGTAKKLTPNSCGQCCAEICTDSDKYRIEFKEGSSAEEKANTIGLALLADYMFFERDLGIITIVFEDGSPVLKCTCCLMSILGQICPCTCSCKLGKNGGDGGGGGPPTNQEMAR